MNIKVARKVVMVVRPEEIYNQWLAELECGHSVSVPSNQMLQILDELDCPDCVIVAQTALEAEKKWKDTRS